MLLVSFDILADRDRCSVSSHAPSITSERPGAAKGKNCERLSVTLWCFFEIDMIAGKDRHCCSLLATCERERALLAVSRGAPRNRGGGREPQSCGSGGVAAGARGEGS